MTEEATSAVIHDVLTTTFMVPPEEISPEAHLEQLELDSLALAEFALILGERLGVRLDETRAVRTTTLREITTYADTLRSQVAAS